MTSLNDTRLRIQDREYVPVVVGGMGVAISTRELALEAAKLGGIGHVSDAMAPAVVDRDHRTSFVRRKLRRFKSNVGNPDKRAVGFDLDELAEATRLHVSSTMEACGGPGAVFLNCMEKLTMRDPARTLRTRLRAAMDAGIDGITLSAGLHLGTFALIEDHRRFRDVALGIIVSSVRALRLFLRKSSRTGRMPDYVIVEGPLAGGHLGFGIEDWREHDLGVIAREVIAFLREHSLDIPVIAAGGIFTASDGAAMLRAGCAGVQVATRFTITEECGLPRDVKSAYLRAEPEDIVVNSISPTGYPMRMLRQSPAIGSAVPPNCEAYGYLLDGAGRCPYVEAYESARMATAGRRISVADKTCLCTQMRRFKVWTCGHFTWRLKDTVRRDEDGEFVLPSAREVFLDYLHGRPRDRGDAPPP